MSLPFTQPQTDTQLLAHKSRVDKCQGIACFEEVARLFDTRSPKKMEREIAGDRIKLDADGRPQYTNVCRRWLGGKCPSDDTLQDVARKSLIPSRLREWRDLLLWTLVQEPFPLSLSTLHDAMAQLSPPVRRIIFLAARPNIHGRYVRYDIGREKMLLLRDLCTLDAFMGLLALAREGELVNDDQRHAFPAMLAFNMFPRIVGQHPQLLASWEDLYECIKLPFWSRIYDENLILTISKEAVAEGLRSWLGG